MEIGTEYRIFKDGDAWCATGQGFVNLQESLAGFGANPLDALSALWKDQTDAESRRREGVRDWKCNNCGKVFSRRWGGDSAPCPVCKCGAQYTAEVTHNAKLTGLAPGKDDQ